MTRSIEKGFFTAEDFGGLPTDDACSCGTVAQQANDILRDHAEKNWPKVSGKKYRYTDNAANGRNVNQGMSEVTYTAYLADLRDIPK